MSDISCELGWRARAQPAGQSLFGQPGEAASGRRGGLMAGLCGCHGSRSQGLGAVRAPQPAQDVIEQVVRLLIAHRA
eukprot:scaffold26890_cov46-Prasinocladus_malaysianus.AAC.3